MFLSSAEDGKPCAQEVGKKSLMIDGCVVSISSKIKTNDGSNVYDNSETKVIKLEEAEKGLDSETWEKGVLEIKINNWEGEVTFSGKNPWVTARSDNEDQVNQKVTMPKE